MSEKTGTLYIVATPIGNLQDLSPRGLATLHAVDLIACEDTRYSKKLCTHFQINTPLTSYYREKEQEKSQILIQKLLDGMDIALISDAGTPCISDPGGIVVQHARQHAIKVITIPGPCAITAALAIAGLKETPFYFGGFLSAKKNERRKTLQALTQIPCPLVFYESPHRLQACLKDMHTVLGNREAMLFRELTKIYEECRQATILELIEQTKKGVKGELVILVQGNTVTEEEKPLDLDDLLLWYKETQQCSLKDAVKHISTDLGLSRSKVYKRALALWESNEEE